MQKTEVQKELERFRDYVISQSRRNLSRLKKNSSKRLYESIKGDVKAMPNSISIQFTMEDYGIFQDAGVSGKKKKYKASSNWQTYYGSSDNLTKDVLQLGHENFNREILHLCLTKGECGYLEAKEQFRNNVLETDNYYNSWIMVRVRKDHIKGYNARILTEYK